MINAAGCNGLWYFGAIAWLSTALILRYQEVRDFFGVPFGGIKRQSDLPFFIARVASERTTNIFQTDRKKVALSDSAQTFLMKTLR